MTQAVKSIGEILNIQGDVIPVTEKNNILKAELENGAVIEGEHRIDLFEGHDPRHRIKRIWQEPKVAATPEVLAAILNAQFIILGPGDLFTSVISNLIVDGIREALISSRAKKIYVCNVMTKPGETTNFAAVDHVNELVKYLGRDILDYVLCSSTKYSDDVLAAYATKQQIPVKTGGREELASVTRANVIEADLASETEWVRHDSLKLAAEIKKIIAGETEKKG